MTIFLVVAGFLAGVGLAAAVGSWLFVQHLTKLFAEHEQRAITGTPDTPKARMIPAPVEAESRARTTWRTKAIENGSKSLMEAAAKNGVALSLEEARLHAAELYDALDEPMTL